MFPELFENEKIMLINVVKDKVRFALDKKHFYNSHTVINCVKWNLLQKVKHRTPKRKISKIKIANGKNYDYKFLLGILNSTFINWYFVSFLSESLHFYPDCVKELPIPKVSLSKQKPIIKLVDKILAAKNEIMTADTLKFEKEIDKLVYALYGLTEEEIEMVEG
jgi:hypothetical protein